MGFGWLRCSVLLSGFVLGVVSLASARAPVVINELMASNVGFVADPQNQYDDWIELYNLSDSPVDVGGWYLTDDLSEPRKWRIPTGNPSLTRIPARGFLVIWADDDTDDAGLHADFGLRAGGEEIGLFDSDGATLIDSISFGPQVADLSYGRDPDGGGDLKLLLVPTPGESNVGVSAEIVAEPQFSHPRGFCDSPFTLELTTSTEGTTIYYTLDGRNPLGPAARGLAGAQYTGPIPISRTTCVRAAATKTGALTSGIVSSTYIFLDQVIHQSERPAGFPATWGGRSADYAMDPRVVTDPAYRDEVEDDLKSIPSVCIVIPNADFFESGGIYANPTATGDQWERAASVEWIDPGAGGSFSVNAGLRIHGGPYSRSQNPKNAFRLNFRAQYGLSRLEYPLFPDTKVDSFNSLALRSIWNYSWSGHCGMSGPANADYLRDVFARDTIRDMGGLTPRGRPVHVYINGLYWGLYILTERPNESFAADHLGGDEDDYDILEAPSGLGASTVMDLVAGDEQGRQAWESLFTMANGNLGSWQAYEAVQASIDVPALIDYMLMVYYTGSRDAPVFLGDSYTPRNFYAIRSREPASPFLIVPWDTEWALEEPTVNRVNVVGVLNPHVLMDRLATNPDFRLLLADQIHRHFHNGGALTREQTTRRYLERADEVRGAIVGESARWGDEPRPSQPYTREDWQAEVDRLVSQYFSGRTETVMAQLKARGLYPSVDAPVFQIDGKDQHGGHAPTGARLGMTKSDARGTIWYTLDGSDPRLPGSTGPSSDLILVRENASKRVLVPTATMDRAWRGGAEFDDSAWIAGAGGVGYERSTGYEPYFDVTVQAAMYGRNTSCYIRIPFDVSTSDLDGLSSLYLRVRYDDGFVAYLNGVEIARANFTGEPAWNARADTTHSDADAVNWESFAVSEHVNMLRAGRNILAIHGLNESTASSDFLVSVELTAGQGSADGGMAAGVSATAIRYVDPVALDSSVRVKARVLSVGTWSAVSDAVFAVGPVAESLRISEIMYHPADDPNAEFVELVNVGTEMMNLNKVCFTDGIDFVFPSVELAPGGYCLVVRDVAAFETAYSADLPVIGRYTGGLSNAGERIELQDAVGAIIHRFRFDDGWYKATDGGGFSLRVVDPSTADPNAYDDPAFWRPSAEPGGSPGTDDEG